MLFSVTKDSFSRLFKLAALVAIEKKSGSNSIVGSHVLLSAQNNNLTLTATDHDVELIVEEYVADGVQLSGAAVVPFRKISEICRAMTENVTLNISVQDPPSLKFNIESSQGCFALNYLLPDVFPIVSHKIFNYEFTVEVKLLQNLFGKVAFAMGDDEGRRFLNGVFLHFAVDEIVSVAADGHRLMVWEVDNASAYNIFNGQTKDPLKILIPRKSVFDVLKIINELSADCLLKIYVGDNHFRIQTNNITYTSRLLAATFPPFKKLIPRHAKNVLTVQREPLKNCLLRAAALLGDRTQGVKVKFSRNFLKITGRSEQEDLVTESLPATFEGDEIEVGFNIKYLLDFLSNVISDTIIFKIENSTTGTLIHDATLSGSYVLMPMQI